VVFRITYKVCVLLFKKIINRLFTLSFEVVKIKWVAEKDHLSKRLAVLNVREEGYSNREIARRIHRSAKVVNNFVEDIENYGKNYRGGIQIATTARGKKNYFTQSLQFHYNCLKN
jgi:hypothetical protein